MIKIEAAQRLQITAADNEVIYKKQRAFEESLKPRELQWYEELHVEPKGKGYPVVTPRDTYSAPDFNDSMGTKWFQLLSKGKQKAYKEAYAGSKFIS